LGNGSDTIVGDGGVDGAVIRLGPDFCVDEVEEFRRSRPVTWARARPPPASSSSSAEQNGRRRRPPGLPAIPGSIGGMVALTPARRGSMSDHLEAVEVATPDGLTWLGARHRSSSAIAAASPARRGAHPGRAVASAAAASGTGPEQRAVRLDLEKRPRDPAAQPAQLRLDLRPIAGKFRGRLIETSGLKGAKRGGAQLSTRARKLHRQPRRSQRPNDVVDLMARSRSARCATPAHRAQAEVEADRHLRAAAPRRARPWHQLPVLLAPQRRRAEVKP